MNIDIEIKGKCIFLYAKKSHIKGFLITNEENEEEVKAAYQCWYCATQTDCDDDALKTFHDLMSKHKIWHITTEDQLIACKEIYKSKNGNAIWAIVCDWIDASEREVWFFEEIKRYEDYF